MRSVRLLVAAAMIIAAAGIAYAQGGDRALSQLEIAVACSPPTTFDPPDGRVPRVVGAQGSRPWSLFARGDLLIIDAGTDAGVQLDQQYYVRRPIYFGTSRRHAQSVATLGWIRIVAANDTTAIASVTHMCDGIAKRDYLEPFIAPVVSPDIVRPDPSGEPDFTMLGRVVAGPENHGLGGANSLMLIDRGADQGSTSGARFAVFRNMNTTGMDKDQGAKETYDGMPLSSIGEAVVVSVGKTMSLAWITSSRDAVIPGDYVVPRK
jgi:hypothetical protein